MRTRWSWSRTRSPDGAFYQTETARNITPANRRLPEAPITVLVDYDGTISLRDVGDGLLDLFLDEPTKRIAAEKDLLYDEAHLGSRELLLWDMDVLPADASLLRDAAAAFPQDEAFPGFVDAVRARGASLEVVSDGLGFYVASNLASIGVTDVPIATNENAVSGRGSGLSFPYGHQRCFVCGTCKRERVRLHQAADQVVVFIGDGASDRFAAAHADVVLAKTLLARICAAAGWPFQPWSSFEDVTEWWKSAFSDGRLPASRSDLERWRGEHGRPPTAFICGPEVWGEGRTTPGPGPG